MTSIALQTSTPVRPIPVVAVALETSGQATHADSQEGVTKANSTPHAADINQCQENKLHQGKMALKLVNADFLKRASTKFGSETEFQGEYKSTKKQVGVTVAGKVRLRPSGYSNTLVPLTIRKSGRLHAMALSSVSAV